jgi:hypothetical protein
MADFSFSEITMRQFHHSKQDFPQRNTLQLQDLLPASRSSTDEKQTTTEPEACPFFSWKSLGTYLEGIFQFSLLRHWQFITIASLPNITLLV